MKTVPVGDVMVSGGDSLDAQGMVLKDREVLSTDGAIVVGVVVNHATKEIIGGPDVQSRGVIYLKDADYIIREVGTIMETVINDAVAEKRYDNLDCRAEAREKIARYVMKETGKRPMILPAIVEINTKE
jgi:ribonuclease J